MLIGVVWVAAGAGIFRVRDNQRRRWGQGRLNIYGHYTPCFEGNNGGILTGTYERQVIELNDKKQPEMKQPENKQAPKQGPHNSAPEHKATTPKK